MVEAGKASVYSVVLLLVFYIPVASQQVDIQESLEGFNAFVNTNFSSSFQMDIGTGLEEISLEDSDGSYSMTERPEKRTRKFVSPRGSLKVEKTPNMSVETVRTPYGVLKTGFREGKNISSFSGPEDLKDKVQEIREKLKSNLSVSSREASVKKSVVMEKMLPDVSLSHEFGDSESITISNGEEESISLDGWKLKNSDPDVYELKKTLSPGEEVVLYPKEAGNVTENAVENTEVDIDETEDSLTLENRLGREIDSETW